MIPAEAKCQKIRHFNEDGIGCCSVLTVNDVSTAHWKPAEWSSGSEFTKPEICHYSAAYFAFCAMLPKSDRGARQ